MEIISMHTAAKSAEDLQDLGKDLGDSPDFLSNDDSGGEQRQASAWSGVKEIAEILRIPLPAAAFDCRLRFPHVRYATGQRMFTIGQRFEALYVLRSGFMKTAVVDAHGNEQVLGFPMRGDLLGADAIYPARHQSEAVALSDCVAIPLPFNTLLALGKTIPEFEASLYGLISRELVREQGMAKMLAGLNAEVKLARFLLTLSQRYAELGYSGKRFTLRMTRRDIGHYLGLSMESVCRVLNAFADLGLIDIDKRDIVLGDIAGLKEMRRLKLRRGH